MPEIELYFSGGLTGNASGGGDEAWSGLCAPLASTSQSGNADLWTEDVVSGHGLSYACGATGEEVCEEVEYRKEGGGIVYSLMFDRNRANHEIMSPVMIIASVPSDSGGIVGDIATCVKSGEIRNSGHVWDTSRVTKRVEDSVVVVPRNSQVYVGKALLYEHAGGVDSAFRLGNDVCARNSMSMTWNNATYGSDEIYLLGVECVDIDTGVGFGTVNAYKAADHGRAYWTGVNYTLVENVGWKALGVKVKTATYDSSIASGAVGHLCDAVPNARGEGQGLCAKLVDNAQRGGMLRGSNVAQLDARGELKWVDIESMSR